MPQLTVRQLIELLQKMPGNAVVETEGCDCEGPCDGAEYRRDGNSVLLNRMDESGKHLREDGDGQ